METSSVLSCVNPYDITPLSGVPLASTMEEGSGRNVKLEMEEFGDLAPFLPENSLKAMENSQDELNTPIFVSEEKGPFDFMACETTYNITPLAADDTFKFEYGTTQMDHSADSNKLNDFSVYSDDVNVQLSESNNNSEVVNCVQGSEALLFATSESDTFIINGNKTPICVQDQISASIINNKNDDSNSVISANSSENQYSNVSSPIDDFMKNSKEAQFLDDFAVESRGDTNGYSVSKVPKLKLSLQMYQHPIIINTPDVIDSVVDLEKAFNILDYIDAKDVTTVNIEDIHFETPSTSKEIKTEPSNVDRPLRVRKRTRRYDDDDDEDYIPPTKKSTSRKIVLDDSDSENSSFSVTYCSTPKRTPSVSSDHSEASKYRELRDKNNEASRKSRLKRKMKEMSLEKEADELEETNIKLKARVAELEKTVSNFRNDLFKIMLRK